MKRYALIGSATLLSAGAVTAQAQDLYRLRVLTTVNAGGAYDVNDAGVVVGSDVGTSRFGSGFRWTNGTLTQTGADSAALGINNSGRVAGAGNCCQFKALLFFPSVNLPLPPSTTIHNQASGISDAGLVVGYRAVSATVDNGLAWIPNTSGQYPSVVILQAPSGHTRVRPWRANSAGTIVGSAQNVQSGEVVSTVAATWQQAGNTIGAPTVLESLGGTFSGATDINEYGIIVGGSRDVKNLSGRACYWDAHGVHDLGILDGVASGANGIADDGFIIGNITYGENDSWPAYWRGSEGTPLRGRIANLGDLTRVVVRAVNNNHWMVGTGYRPNGSLVAVLLTPICYADCDQSTGPGILDIFDFLCFGNAFDSGDPYACDCDTSTGPGVCDIFDFLCFGNAISAGCP